MATATATKSRSKMTADERNGAIYQEAHQAGLDALNAATATPMVATERVDPMDDTSPVKEVWVVPQGVCGFAWVRVVPGTSSFARYLRKTGLGRTSVDGWGGVRVSVREGKQSLELKEAYAGAFARVLRSHGIDAYAESRMD